MVLAKEKGARMRSFIAAVILMLAFSAHIFADSSALILSGVPGDPEHAERFGKWTETTRKLLVEKFGFSADHVVVLADKQTAKADIQKAFDQLRMQLKPADTFFLFLIGHGSYDTEYKFNIFGPDFTGAEYNQLLGTLKVGRIVVVNGSSASGGLIEALTGKNRMIITATKSGHEGNDTTFYGHFLDALQDPAADEDKDQKVSVWEAFKFATEATDRHYTDEGKIETEHPQISVNGTPAIGASPKDPPLLARLTTFQVDRPVTVSDPKLQALLNDKRELDQKIEALKIAKESIPAPEYEKQMEDLLVALALKNQEIKAQQGKKP
jgi:Caspase domain